MADFLNRLAARALGTIPLAEPAVPTRFSSGTRSHTDLAFEPAFQPRPYPEASLAIPEDRSHPTHIHETNPHLEASVARPASPLQNLGEAPHLPQSQPARAFRRQVPSPPPSAESEIHPPSAEPHEPGKQHLVAAMDRTIDAVERAAAYKPQVIPPAQVSLVEPKPAPRPAQLAEPVRSPELLQHAERLQAFRPVPPTVSVSIGRIEVRAEVTAPSTTTAAQRPRPATLSLDQFLKQVSGSAR